MPRFAGVFVSYIGFYILYVHASWYSGSSSDTGGFCRESAKCPPLSYVAEPHPNQSIRRWGLRRGRGRCAWGIAINRGKGLPVSQWAMNKGQGAMVNGEWKSGGDREKEMGNNGLAVRSLRRASGGAASSMSNA